jgi:hypothetical protein
MFYNPLQFDAGVYPFDSASSFEENHTLFSSLIARAPGHHGKWYLAPFREPTKARSGANAVAACATAEPSMGEDDAV